nr:hypothetical protein [Halomonas sp. MC140]
MAASKSSVASAPKRRMEQSAYSAPLFNVNDDFYAPVAGTAFQRAAVFQRLCG